MLDKNLLQENIIKLLGIEMLSDEKKTALLDQMADLLQKRLFARLVESLPDIKKQEFLALANSSDEKNKDKFVQENFPDFSDIIAEEIVKLKEELKDFLAGPEA